MENEETKQDRDSPEGGRLSRKEAIALIGGAGIVAGATWSAGCGGGGTPSGAATPTPSPSPSPVPGATPTPTPSPTPAPVVGCTLTPSDEIGPFPLLSVLSNSTLVRSDVREGKTGVPLTLDLTLLRVGDSCGPIASAYIYIWQCDAAGEYSGYSSGQNGSHSGETYLRGIQKTDAGGKATFQTVYPGWYAGRVTHIHFQVYLTTLTGTATISSQLAFPDATTRTVYASALYAKGQNTSVSSNAADHVFSDGTTGELLAIAGSVAAGYAASLVIGVN